ncbi:DUF4344 domain-containing metallopeptidase [Roseobacter sp. YSTF-M11]|uniref:DUF4344 domain-containing metallopeptidase n=1 Tax=Roseobacter insulae TaxID=2859783 RepID=A0A9X1FZ33_9RHOB|nr:DUF4344 domain-containing metallopeptidase [Roseobacter insulae]MBW4709675.1 DUF4344 domain-containing metallopeptidase [Roseobacter insulae]
MFVRLKTMLLLCGMLVSGAAGAQDRDDAFVSANVLAILYHEMGHALIDVLQLPVFGQEEDAADVLSVLLIDAFFEEDDAVEIMYDAAFGFLRESEENALALWDVHGPDLQRYYTMICLFYGANPDAREDLALELELPQERLDTCVEEFDLADASWGAVLDDIATETPGRSLVFTGDSNSYVGQILAEEVDALNRDFVLPDTLRLSAQSCDEPNGFYDPETQEIILCEELDGHLRALADF